MKKIISLLGILLFLTSCYSNPKDLDRIEELKNKNTKLQDTVSQLEETNKNDIFEKNKECGLLRNEIKDELFDPQYTFGILDPQIEEIFYSQKKNSCLYIFSYRKPACEGLDILSDLWKELSCNRSNRVLVDFFTKIYITEDSGYNDNIIERCEKNDSYENCLERHGFENKVQNYRN